METILDILMMTALFGVVGLGTWGFIWVFINRKKYFKKVK